MNPLETKLLKQAIDFATLSLAGKKRKSGEDVIDHCIRVANDLVAMNVTDQFTLVAAVLHHCVADGAATYKDVSENFGEEVTAMIRAFDSLKIVKLGEGQTEMFVENLRKMFLVLAKDLRVVLIKMADIQDNLKTLSYLEKDKRHEVAQETIEIFAPMAERLGMGELRGDLQDLSFPFYNFEGYKWVKNYTKNRLSKLGKMMLQVKAKLMIAFNQQQIPVDIESRVKHVYSLYTKLLRPEIGKDLDKVYDLIALRLLVQTEEECYKILGIVHKIFPPAPGQTTDYIAHPKPNGYKSIHTKVIGPSNIIFEIQIRTHQMHEEAEYGVAAHWNYADMKSQGNSDEKISQGFAAGAEKLEWVKRLSEWQKEIADNQEFLKTIKTDFFGDRIYCFTPKGDVIDLPNGATPIDFAYKVHTNLGNLVTSASVNNRVVSLDTKLKNADVVQLNLSKDTTKKPSRDWLLFVATSLAKKKIKSAYK
ncbi:HD domain-containing protein [Patescibacteria group bacterium]|nr:HD domain-containing protein [Patescibacteria group bacterium]